MPLSLLDAKLSFSFKKDNKATTYGKKRQTKADGLRSLGENAECWRREHGIKFQNAGA